MEKYQPPTELVLPSGYPDVSFTIDHEASALLARKRDEPHATEERWLELEEKRTHLSGVR